MVFGHLAGEDNLALTAVGAEYISESICCVAFFSPRSSCESFIFVSAPLYACEEERAGERVSDYD